MDRFRPKLTEDDRRLCGRMMTAFIWGDKEMLELVMAEVDQADAVTAVLLGLCDAACSTMEKTGPLLVGPDEGGQAQA